MLSRENSIITDLFEGQLLTTRKCTSCKHKRYTFDSCWDIPLAFGNKDSRYRLENMLKEFMKEEDCIGQVECGKCKNTKLTLKSEIWELPEILVVTFKR